MFEVIWSVFANKYILRTGAPVGRVTPNFIGTQDECIAHLRNCFPR